MSTSSLEEIRSYILEARAQCQRGIANQNERLSWGGRASQFKIDIFEKAVAKYDRWLDASYPSARSHHLRESIDRFALSLS